MHGKVRLQHAPFMLVSTYSSLDLRGGSRPVREIAWSTLPEISECARYFGAWSTVRSGPFCGIASLLALAGMWCNVSNPAKEENS